MQDITMKVNSTNKIHMTKRELNYTQLRSCLRCQLNIVQVSDTLNSTISTARVTPIPEQGPLRSLRWQERTELRSESPSRVHTLLLRPSPALAQERGARRRLPTRGSGCAFCTFTIYTSLGSVRVITQVICSQPSLAACSPEGTGFPPRQRRHV